MKIWEEKESCGKWNIPQKTSISQMDVVKVRIRALKEGAIKITDCPFAHYYGIYAVIGGKGIMFDACI